MRKPIILLTLLLTYLGLVIYANRALFFSRFDEPYWRDRYEHSQWKLPLSQRTIGDDGLYLYEGYRLIRGGDPTTANAEMPPLGKYLIGASVLLFRNGQWYGFLTTATMIVGTFLLAKLLFKQTAPALFIAILLATDPLITNQYTLTMMDSLQSALLITWLFLLLRRRPFFAGLALGLFSVTKIALLSPVLLLVSLWFFRKGARWTFFLLGGVVGYFIPYTIYFSQGHTITDWLKVQKWMMSFYLHSNLIPTWGSAVTTLLIGKYQNIFSRVWETVSEWSPAWGLLLLSSIWGITRVRKLASGWIVVFSVGTLVLVIFSFIPFWTRYLVLFLPLLYLTGFLVFQKYTMIITALLLINIVSSYRILFPLPQPTIRQVLYNIEHGFFSDVYQDTTRSYRVTVNRNEFNRFGLQTLADGEIEHMTIEQLTQPRGRQSPQQVDVQITYMTRRLGKFTQTVTIPIVLEDNRWRVPWSWSIFVPGLSSETRLHTVVEPARRGSIIGSDKKPLAEDIDGVLVWVTPNNMDKTKEDSLLTLLETVFDGNLPKVAIHQRIVGNTTGDIPIPIGVIPHPKTDPNVLALTTFAGVTFTDAFTRVTHPNNVVDIGILKNTLYSPCCSLLYSTTNFDGITGAEKSKNTLLKGINGGTLMLKDAQGIILKTYIDREKVDGKDVEP